VTVVVAPNKNIELVSNMTKLLLGHYAEGQGEHYVSLIADSEQIPLPSHQLAQVDRTSNDGDLTSRKFTNVQLPNLQPDLDIGNVHHSVIADDLKDNLIKNNNLINNKEPDSQF